MIPICAASTAAPSDTSSQGWATAVGIAGMPWVRSMSSSYLPLPVAASFVRVVMLSS
jgi:hypothetical protein